MKFDLGEAFVLPNKTSTIFQSKLIYPKVFNAFGRSVESGDINV